MRIRTKMTLLVVAPLILVVGIILVSLVRIQRRTFEAHAASRIDALMEGAVRIGRESLRARDDLMLLSYLMHLQRERPELELALVTWKGRTKVVGEVRSDLLYRTRVVTRGDGSDAYDAVSGTIPGPSISSDAGQDGLMTLQFGFSKTRLKREVDEALAVMTTKILSLAGIVVLLGILAAIGVGRLMAAPISALALAAAEVGKGRLDTSVDVGPARKDEIGALAKEFNRMTARLRELMLAKEDLVHTLSHEINTPLGGLKLYIGMLRDGGLPKNASAREDLILTMENAVTRMEITLQSALHLARSGEEVVLHPRTVRLDTILRETLELFAPAAESRNIAVAGPASDKGARVHATADEELLRRVAVNLVSNALKYTPDGGRVSVGAEESPDGATFWVEDTGPGIAPGDRESIFTKFYRVRENGKSFKRVPGSGLGLAIAKKAVDLHGGRIWVESEPGKGSKFFVYLPKGKISSVSERVPEKSHEKQ